MAWREIKTLKGFEYIYERWKENGVTHSRYIGPVDPKAPRLRRKLTGHTGTLQRRRARKAA